MEIHMVVKQLIKLRATLGLITNSLYKETAELKDPECHIARTDAYINSAREELKQLIENIRANE